MKYYLQRCTLGQRKLGEDVCTSCPSGTYYDNGIFRNVRNTSTWISEQCVSCQKGTYAPEDLPAINQCFECSPGNYQNNTGSSNCTVCEEGSYQPEFGKEICIPCAKGGFCDASKQINGGFTACRSGTYNEKDGQSDQSACTECLPGTYSSVVGATNSTICEPCPTGTYNNQSGKLELKM